MSTVIQQFGPRVRLVDVGYLAVQQRRGRKGWVSSYSYRDDPTTPEVTQAATKVAVWLRDWLDLTQPLKR